MEFLKNKSLFGTDNMKLYITYYFINIKILTLIIIVIIIRQATGMNCPLH
jgi:hypothetical protein